MRERSQNDPDEDESPEAEEVVESPRRQEQDRATRGSDAAEKSRTRPRHEIVLNDSTPQHTGYDYLGARGFPKGSSDTSTPPEPDPLSESILHHLGPDAPRRKTGPFGASTILHILAIAFLIYSGLVKKAEAPSRPPLTIGLFEQPTIEERPPPAARKPPLAPPHPQPKIAQAPPAEPKSAERQPITPPAPPKIVPPPPTDLPAPKRMGEIVPVPHFPVPGSVPPEEGKSGRPGPPAPEAPAKPPGEEQAANETDPGVGRGAGPGTGGDAALGEESDAGQVKGGSAGNLDVPRLGGGSTEKRGREGQGSRKGLNLALPTIGGTFGDFSFEGRDYDWTDYHSQMYYRILYAWYNRLYVDLERFDRWSYQHGGARLEGSVLIRFVIERNGSVSSIDVLEPSVMQPLDESAVNALKEVILPALPPDFTRVREGVTGRFTMSVDNIPGFKMEMKYRKSRGEF